MVKQKGKCEAKLLGIIHEYIAYLRPWSQEEQKIIEEFKRHVTPGKILYIERSNVRKRSPDKMATLYDILINHALEQGMKVVSILNNRTEALSVKLDKLKWAGVKEVAEKVGMPRQKFESTASIYGVSPLRERSWVRKLRNAQKGDLIVMFPAHAYRIAPLIGIDRKRIFYLSRTEEDAKSFWRKELHWKRLKKFNEIRKKLREQRRKPKPV